MSTQIKYLDYDGLVYYHSKVKTALGNKVDKVSGKGLSTNDFTNTLKNKLDGIANGAQVNVLEGINVNGSAVTPTNKIVNLTVPTKTSDLTNDSDFVSDANYVHTDNNFTTELKDKLNGIATGAEANVQSDWNITDTSSDAFIKNKPAIPTKTSDLTNDSGFITSADYASSATGGVVKITSAFGTTMSESGEVKGVVVSGTDYPAMWNDAIVSKGTLENALSTKRFATLSDVPTKTSELTNDSNFVSNTSYATSSTGGVVKVGSGLEITNGVLSTTGGGVADAVEWDNVLNKPTFSTVATSGSYNDLTDKPTPQTVNDATLTIQRNNTNVGTFTANASSDKTINITVPTTVAELSDASTYVTQSNLATQLANKQNVLTAGDHINITDSTIKAVDYVHSEDPAPTSQVTPVVTNDMIADGTITADKLASGATVKLTLSTSDIGEGAALAANTLYGVYQQ